MQASKVIGRRIVGVRQIRQVDFCNEVYYDLEGIDLDNGRTIIVGVRVHDPADMNCGVESRVIETPPAVKGKQR